MQAQITSKGQITLPKKLRDRLQLETGSVVRFEFLDDGGAALRRMEPVTALFGVVRIAGRNKVSRKEIQDAIEKEASGLRD